VVFFPIVDVVAVLTDSVDIRNFWKVLESWLKQEGSELDTNCNQLKMQPAEGKFYNSDCATIEQLFRMIPAIYIAQGNVAQ